MRKSEKFYKPKERDRNSEFLLNRPDFLIFIAP